MSNPQITVKPQRTIVVQVSGTQGPSGAPGGSGVTSYQHIQQTLSNAWTIAHGLKRKPSITVLHNNIATDGTIIHNSNDVAVVTFAVAIDGTAYCI